MHAHLGDEVKQGDLLLEFDIDIIESKADSIASPVVFVDKKMLKIKKTKEIEGHTYITIITE